MMSKTTISNQILTPAAVGLATLEHLGAADLLNEWMFETIRPFVKGRVLEIGSGIGNISSCFAADGIPLTLSDLRADYCQRLRQKFAAEPMVEDVIQLDLTDEAFDSHYSGFHSAFNTVFALNVVEHIADDALAIENCRKLLAGKGHLIILVPAYPALYNGLDRELDHYRRYTYQSVRKLLFRHFELVKISSFNLAGIFGWYYSGSIMKKQALPSHHLNLYNKLVPLFRIADALTFHRIGLSVVAVGRRR
jgi:SAM-dependent methyltransferase